MNAVERCYSDQHPVCLKLVLCSEQFEHVLYEYDSHSHAASGQ